MNWGAKDWIAWAGAAKAFFSARGAIVTKLIVPMDREGEFFLAAIEDPDKYDGKIDGMANTLHGIPIMFTSKLPAHRMLFESKADEAA